MPRKQDQVSAISVAVLLLSLAMGVFAGPSLVKADDVKTIVATVNDEPISSFDVNQRVRLAILSSNLKPTPELIQHISAQVLRGLIDEKLRLQEVKRLEVPVEKSEIDDEITNIAQTNGMSLAQFREHLKKNGITEETLRDQLEVEIGWAKLVRGRFSRNINISDQEIDYTYKQALETAKDPRYLISEIYLDVPNADQQRGVMKSAMGLLDQIRKGAPFPQVAHQFSQSISAAQGGDVGWVEAADLDDEVANELSRMSPGQISPPIAVHDAVIIVALRDRYVPGQGDPTKSTISMRQLFVPAPDQASQAQLQKMMEETGKIRSEIKGCDSLDKLASKYEDSVAVDAETFRVGDLPGPIQEAVMNLHAGQVSAPVGSSGGVHMFVICSRKDQKVEIVQPTREEIANRLYSQQLGIHAKRYVRDLRADATIDYLH